MIKNGILPSSLPERTGRPSRGGTQLPMRKKAPEAGDLRLRTLRAFIIENPRTLFNCFDETTELYTKLYLLYCF